MSIINIFKLSSNNEDPVEEIRFNSLYGELFIKFKTSPKMYKYEANEIVEQKIKSLRRKKNYSKMVKIIKSLKQIP